jgi:hypothetical protein
MLRRPPVSVSPTKPPRPSPQSPTRRNCVDGVGPAQDRGRGDPFKAKILALARGFAGGPPPDFAKASFAELYAWSLAQPPAE